MAEQRPRSLAAHHPPWDRWFETRIYPSPEGLSIFFTDITSRRRAELALAEARGRLGIAMQAANVAFWDFDPVTGSTHLSEEWKRHLGYEPHEVRDHYDEWEGRLHPDDRPRALATLRDAIARKSTYESEFRLRHRDGSYRWVLSRGAPVGTDHPASFPYQGCHVDITELKRAQEERENLLRRVEAEKQRLERLAECVPSGIVLAEAPSGKVLFSNRRAAELLGRPVRPIQSVADYERSRFYSTGGRVLAAEEYPLARAVATGETILDEEYHYERPDGGRRTFLVSAVGVPGESGEIASAIASFHDVTESRQARDALRGLSQRLLAAQEEERRKISLDLHDDLGQVLTALKLSLASLAQGPGGESLRDAVGQALGMLDGALDRARALSLHLRPPMLDQLGLGPTLRWYLDDALRDSTLAPSVSISLADAELPGELASACFRVAQEAVTNALRHAEARRLWLRVDVRKGVLRLHVRDDGRGFDVESARAAAAAGRSLGLVGMQERVALAGGNLAVRSRPGAGTRVVARFPFRRLSGAEGMAEEDR